VHSPKNYVIGFLALTTVAVTVLSWRQYQELIGLRAAALNPRERAEWQQRLWDAEKRRADLERQLEGNAVAARGETTNATNPGETMPDAPVVQNAGRGSGRGRFAAMMEQPEVQRLMAMQQKAALDSRYAALFKSLALTPDQLDKLKNLLVDKSTAMADVMMAAREQGINPRQDREAFRQLVEETQADIDATIRSTLGETAFAQYQDYERTLPQRSIVEQLEQRLSYSGTPLTSEQSNQVLAILASSQAATTASGPEINLAGRGPLGPFVGRGSAAITEQALQQSAGVLAAPQIEALRQLQQEQQAQRDLANAFRTQAGNTPAGSRGASPPPPPGG
jgi:hypothetical protein